MRLRLSHKKKILGIAKGIPFEFDVDQFCSEAGIESARHLGASTVVKIDFTDLLPKARLLKTGLKIGYELIRVSEFLTPPRCCHNFRFPSHIQSACSSSNPKCEICSGPHVSTKDSPCILPAKCANCGGPHLSFSLKYQVLKKVISAAK